VAYHAVRLTAALQGAFQQGKPVLAPEHVAAPPSQAGDAEARDGTEPPTRPIHVRATAGAAPASYGESPMAIALSDAELKLVIGAAQPLAIRDRDRSAAWWRRARSTGRHGPARRHTVLMRGLNVVLLYRRPDLRLGVGGLDLT